jgi:hypothetical protein
MDGTTGVKGSRSSPLQPQGAYGDAHAWICPENAWCTASPGTCRADKDGITHGGIGLDNAGKVPREFLEALARRLNARGLGIAANGCPDEYLAYIDFFGNEGFPFSINDARRAREKGLRGILGEFTMQHLPEAS